MWSGVIDAAGLLAALMALGFLLAGRRRAVRTDVRALFASLVLIMIFRNLDDMVECFGGVSALDPIEGYIETLSPVLWFFFFYAFLQGSVQRELAESEERNRILLESLPQRIFFKDSSSAFVSVNEPFARDFSLQPEQLRGKTDWDLFPRELARKYRGDDRRVMDTGKPETLIEKNVAGGVERTVEVVKAPVVSDEGDVIGLFGIFTDVTERLRAEQELRDRERFLNSIFASIQDGLSILDTDLNIVRVNPTLEQWYAHSLPLAGRKCYEAYHGRDRPCDVCPSRETLETGKAAFAVVPKSGPGGEVAGWLDLYTFPRMDPATGQLEGVIEYVRDITARKQAEDALQRRSELERLITSISTGFIDLSHDEIDEGVNKALRTVGEFAGVDRTYVFQFREHTALADNTHEWCAPGVTAQIQNLKGVSFADELPWVLGTLRNHEVLHIPRVADLPPEAESERAHFGRQDIQSLLAVPMIYEGTLMGLVGFDSVRSEKKWDEDAIVLLRIMSAVFSSALQRKRSEEAQRASEERYRLVFENATDMISLHSLDDLRYLYVNPAIRGNLGYTEEELVGTTAFRWVHPDDRDVLRARLSEAMATGQGSVEFRYRQKSGAYVWLEATGRTVLDERGERVALLISRDITDRVLRREELRALSLADPLTHLNNRRGFFHLAEQQLKVSNRTRSTMLLFFTDVDNMKWINDNLGHKEGDLALIETGNVLKEAFRESDIVGRVGGDEFAVLALQAKREESNEILARLQRRLDARNAQPDRRYRLSLSVGIACYEPEEPLPLEELMARADALMYENKRAKRSN
jgi:diguanylate cyclase (GGDEF)-like protein/PAS domain S-box-containing protein